MSNQYEQCVMKIMPPRRQCNLKIKERERKCSTCTKNNFITNMVQYLALQTLDGKNHETVDGKKHEKPTHKQISTTN